MVIVFFRTLYVHCVFAVLLCTLRRIAFLLLAHQKIWVCRELWFSKNLGLSWISIGVIFVLWQWKAWHWVGITEYNQNDFSGIMRCLVPALKDPIIKRAVLHCRKGYWGGQESRASDSFLFQCLPGLLPLSFCQERRDYCKVWHKISPFSPFSLMCKLCSLIGKEPWYSLLVAQFVGNRSH